MTVYMSEEEQIQQIKLWWKKYGNMISIAISIVLLSIAGFRYWNWHKNSIAQQASGIYERMMVAYADKDYKQVQSNSQRLIDDFNNTIYADVAHLTLAKVAVGKSKYKLAKNSLNAIISDSKSQLMIDVARIRLARILIFEKSYSQALEIVNKIKDKSMLAMANEIKGDISFAENNREKAVEFYNTAIQEAEKNGAGSLFLEMKAKQIAVKNNSKLA